MGCCDHHPLSGTPYRGILHRFCNVQRIRVAWSLPQSATFNDAETLTVLDCLLHHLVPHQTARVNFRWYASVIKAEICIALACNKRIQLCPEHYGRGQVICQRDLIRPKAQPQQYLRHRKNRSTAWDGDLWPLGELVCTSLGTSHVA